MKLTLRDPAKCEQFVTTFMNIKIWSETLNITIDNNRLYAQGMDPSHVALFEISLWNNWFDIYEVEDGCSHHIGVSLPILNKLLKTWKSGYSIELKYKENDSSMEIFFDGPYAKAFQMSLMDIDMELLQIPPTEHPLEMAMPSDTWKELMDNMIMFGDTVSILCNEDHMKFRVKEEGQLCSMKTTIESKDFYHFDFDTNHDDIRISYALGYLQKVCSFHKLSPHIYVHLNPEVPIQLSYIFDTDHENDKTNGICFYIAPKQIEEEDEEDDEDEDMGDAMEELDM